MLVGRLIAFLLGYIVKFQGRTVKNFQGVNKVDHVFSNHILQTKVAKCYILLWLTKLSMVLSVPQTLPQSIGHATRDAAKMAPHTSQFPDRQRLMDIVADNLTSFLAGKPVLDLSFALAPFPTRGCFRTSVFQSC